MKTPKPQKILLGRYRLKFLVAFLEMDFKKIATDETLPILQRAMLRVARYPWPPRGKPLKFVERANWRRGAKKVQAELREDLQRLVSTTGGPDHDKFVLRLIDKLGRANKNGHYETGWESSPRRQTKTLKNRRLSPAAVFARATSELFAKDGGEILSGGTVYSLDWGPGDSLRDFVYFQLGRAIEERCLEDLRTCRQCARLFVAAKDNQESCDSRCKDAFHNLRRQRPEWNGKPYHRYIRDRRRQRRRKSRHA